MAITPARERVRKSRERKRRGVIPVQLEVSTLEIDFLRRRGYGARSGDPLVIVQRFDVAFKQYHGRSSSLGASLKLT